MNPHVGRRAQSKQHVDMWRSVIRRIGSPIVAASIAAVTLPVSVYHVIQARSSALLITQLQTRVATYTDARVGVVLPSLVGFDIEGQRVSVNLSAGKTETLIFGVSASCIYCMDMLDVHRRLAEAAGNSGRAVYWVSRDGLDDAASSVYAQIAGKDHFLVEPTNATYRALGLGFTPQTILVSADGTVKAAWKGVTSDKIKIENDIRRAMGVSQNTP